MNKQPAYFARHAKITIAVCLVSLNVMVSTSGMLAAVEAGGQDLPDSIRVKLHGVHSMGFVRNSGLYPSSICYVLSLRDGVIALSPDRIEYLRYYEVEGEYIASQNNGEIRSCTHLSEKLDRRQHESGNAIHLQRISAVELSRNRGSRAALTARGVRTTAVNVIARDNSKSTIETIEYADTIVYDNVRSGYKLYLSVFLGRLEFSVDSYPGSGDSAALSDATLLISELQQLLESIPGLENDTIDTAISAGVRLTYSTLLGGERGDVISRILHLREGVYVVAGTTRSILFPITSNAFDTSFRGDTSSIYGRQVFVSCIDITNSRLLYSTYFGGYDIETVVSLAENKNHDVVFAGYTWSDDLPTTAGAYQPRYRGNGDGYVAALDSNGSRLLFCTYLGGSGIENLRDMKLDNEGNIVLSGLTDSRDFPTTPGVLQRVYGGGDDDMFVAKLSGDGSRLLFGTYIGGAGWDEGYNLQLLGARGILVSGATNSDNFPVTPDALYPRRLGYDEGCLLILDNNARGLVYSTYIAWDAHENVWDAQLDDSDVFTLFGITTSTNLPTTESSFQRRKGGYPVYNQLSADYYLLRFRLGATEPLACTYIGGSGSDRYPRAFQRILSGMTLIGGLSPSNDYPVTEAMQGSETEESAVLTIIDSSFSNLVYGIRYGGSDYTTLGDAYYQNGTIALAGMTYSNDYPLTPDAMQKMRAGQSDGFLTFLDVAGILVHSVRVPYVLPVDELRGAYPDPAPRHATVTFLLSGPGRARVTIHDLLGRTLHTVVDAALPAGEHARGISTAGMPGGVYILRLHTERGTHTKMLRVAGG